MNRTKKVLFMVIGILATQWAIAQGPGGQRRDPADMIKKEKAMINDNITTLSDEQKAKLDKVFVDYEASMKKARSESSGDVQGMREIMQSVRADKEEAVKGVLNEEQNSQYQELIDKMRKEQRKGRGNRPGGVN